MEGLRCADFGCNIGGFTDCLLQAGAAHVTAIDTGYGALAWKLRQDPRVRVMERTNALHAPPPPEGERVDLIVIDMAWTPQRLCIPAAIRWLRPGGRIITLVKPHYELEKTEKDTKLRDGVLAPEDAAEVVARVLASLAVAPINARVLAHTQSPIRGGAGKGKGNAQGNLEWLALVTPT